MSCIFIFLLMALPPKIDPKAHYIFYLHGRIVEDQGVRPRSPQYGYYEYQQILDALSGRGFTVISERRAKGTDPAEYSRKVAAQIRSLIAARVVPSNICVIGASKGALITLLTSTLLEETQVRYVIMAGCNDAVEETYHPKLNGEVLSIFEESDEIGRSCKNIFTKSPALRKSEEKQLHTGLAHGFLYRPLKEWVEPAVNWCSRPD